jgi:hypothetical protein
VIDTQDPVALLGVDDRGAPARPLDPQAVDDAEPAVEAVGASRQRDRVGTASRGAAIGELSVFADETASRSEQSPSLLFSFQTVFTTMRPPDAAKAGAATQPNTSGVHANAIRTRPAPARKPIRRTG